MPSRWADGQTAWEECGRGTERWTKSEWLRATKDVGWSEWNRREVEKEGKLFEIPKSY